MKKFLALCPYCNGVRAMAVADTPDETIDALKAANEWAEEGLTITQREHEESDPMPRWCDAQGDCE